MPNVKKCHFYRALKLFSVHQELLECLMFHIYHFYFYCCLKCYLIIGQSYCHMFAACTWTYKSFNSYEMFSPIILIYLSHLNASLVQKMN